MAHSPGGVAGVALAGPISDEITDDTIGLPNPVTRS